MRPLVWVFSQESYSFWPAAASPVLHESGVETAAAPFTKVRAAAAVALVVVIDTALLVTVQDPLVATSSQAALNLG
jgi:hypothetical protein